MALVFDIERCKLSQLALPAINEVGRSTSRRVFASLVAEYKDFEDFTSEDFIVRPGSTCAVPWEKSLLSLNLQIFMLGEMETIEIGVAKWDPSFLQRLETVLQGNPSEYFTLDIILPIINGSKSHVGKIFGKISTIGVEIDQIEGYEGQEDGMEFTERMANEAGLQAPMPLFKFEPMTKAMNWDNIHGLDLDSIITNNSLYQLVNIVDDLCFGGVALYENVEADPALLNAIGLQQLSMQYMKHCGIHLSNRASLMESALRSFEEEEKCLDLLTAKLQGRIHAYSRESASLDDLQANYINVLENINPELYQEYVRGRGAGDRGMAEVLENEEERAIEEKTQNEHRRERKEGKLKMLQSWREEATTREGHSSKNANDKNGGFTLRSKDDVSRVVQNLNAKKTHSEDIERSLDADLDCVRPFAAPDMVRSLSSSPSTVGKSRFVQVSVSADLREGDPASPLPKEGIQTGATPLSSLPGSPLASPLVTRHKKLGVSTSGNMSLDDFEANGQGLNTKLPPWAQAVPAGANNSAVASSLMSVVSADSLGGAWVVSGSADGQGDHDRLLRASTGEALTKPPLWVQAALNNAGVGSSSGVAISSMQSAMSADSLATDAAPAEAPLERGGDRQRRLQITQLEEASESSSTSSSGSSSSSTSSKSEADKASAEVTPIKVAAAATAPLAFTSPDEDFTQAETLALEEAARAVEHDNSVDEGTKGDKHEAGSPQEQSTGKLDNPLVQQRPIGDSASQEPTGTPVGQLQLLPSPLSAEEKPERNVWNAVQGELQDVEDFDLVQDFSTSMDGYDAVAMASEVKRAESWRSSSENEYEGKDGKEAEPATNNTNERLADAKNCPASNEGGTQAGFKSAKDGDDGPEDRQNDSPPRMLNVSYSADNLIATDVTYTEDTEFVDSMGAGTPGAAQSLDRSGSFFNESDIMDVMGRSHEDYYDNYDYGREEHSPSATQARSWFMHDTNKANNIAMNISQQSDGIAADGGRYGRGAASTSMSFYEEGSTGLGTSSGGEEEPVVLFGAKREGVSAFGAGQRPMSLEPTQPPFRKDAKANPNPLSLSQDSDDEEYAEDFDEPIDDNDDDVLIGTKTINRTSLDLNLDSTGGLSRESGLPPTGRQSLSATGDTSSSSSSGLPSVPTLSSAANTKSMEQLKGLLGASQSAPPAESADGSAPAATVDTGDGPLFRSGRAPVDVVSMGGAMDIFVSSVLLNDATKERMGSLQMQFFFLSEHSKASEVHHFPALSGGASRMKMLPVNYSANIKASVGVLSSLSDEIQMEEEALSCSLFVQDGSTGENIGRAKINLWRMIEDSTNIIRQEVDIYSLGGSGSAVIGSIIVDVRGFTLLTKAMQN